MIHSNWIHLFLSMLWINLHAFGWLESSVNTVIQKIYINLLQFIFHFNMSRYWFFLMHYTIIIFSFPGQISGFLTQFNIFFFCYLASLLHFLGNSYIFMTVLRCCKGVSSEVKSSKSKRKSYPCFINLWFSWLLDFTFLIIFYVIPSLSLPDPAD